MTSRPAPDSVTRVPWFTFAAIVGIGYGAWKLLGPLFRSVGAITRAAGAAAEAAVEAGTGVAKAVLGLPQATWLAFAGKGARFTPLPKWTPEFVRDHPGALSYLQVAGTIATWAYAAKAAAGAGAQVFEDGVRTWLREHNAHIAYPELRTVIMRAYGWTSPSQGVHDGSPLDMAKGGSLSLSLRDGVPVDKLYRWVAHMVAAGPGPDIRGVQTTAGYFTWLIWTEGLFPPSPIQEGSAPPLTSASSGSPAWRPLNVVGGFTRFAMPQ